jgi:hypothetical protein
MYKLEVKLKQHTPLIHFQHDQEGATLRASEVKPKLDRFILTKLGKGDGVFEGDDKTKYEKIKSENANKSDYEIGCLYAKDKNWIIKGQDHALDYKINIRNFGEAKSINIDYKETRDGKYSPKFPCIFGNVFEDEKKVFRVSDEQDIIIKTYYRCLYVNIDFALTDFFFASNFGFRQSKGFGSFHTGDFLPQNTSNYYFTLNLRQDDYKNLFNAIDLFYKCLKSGLNLKDYNRETKKLEDKLYFKSLMFKFAKKQNPPEQWDKRTIRHSLFLGDWKYKKDSNKSGIYYDRTGKDGTVHFTVPKTGDRKYYDFRDLLGLSSEQEWSFYNDKINKTLTSREQFEIERFQSPIIFKPYYCISEGKWYVYILANRVPDEYTGANVKVVNGRGRTVDLTIYPNFNTLDYLIFAITDFNVSDFEYGIKFNSENVREVSLLNDIFSQLKKQTI